MKGWQVYAAAAFGLALLGGGTVAVIQWTDAVSFVRVWWAAFEGTGLDGEARALAIAQAAYESGWGKNTPARLGFNPWNLTRTASDTRPVIVAGDTDGAGNPIVQRFRKYGSPAEAARDYLAFLGTARYAQARAALYDADALRFAAELSRAGYYTAPPAAYAAGLAAVVSSVDRRLGAAGVA